MIGGRRVCGCASPILLSPYTDCEATTRWDTTISDRYRTRGRSIHCHPQPACSTRDFAGEWPTGAHGRSPDGTLLGHLASANARSFERSRVASGVAVVTRILVVAALDGCPWFRALR